LLLRFSDEVVGSLDVLDEPLVPHNDVEGNDFKNICFRGCQTKKVEIELKVDEIGLHSVLYMYWQANDQCVSKVIQHRILDSLTLLSLQLSSNMYSAMSPASALFPLQIMYRSEFAGLEVFGL
jgi:hypothetical protein